MGGEHLTSKACGQERLATSERMNWVSLKLRRLPGVRTTHLCLILTLWQSKPSARVTSGGFLGQAGVVAAWERGCDYGFGRIVLADWMWQR